MVAPLLLATLLAAAAPAAEPPAVEPPDWKTYGWSLSDVPAPDEACPFASPSLDPVMTTWNESHAPEKIQRPTVRCSGVDLVLPLAPDPGFLVRRETPEPHLEWNPHVDGFRNGTALVLRVDVPPDAPDIADPKSAHITLGGLQTNGAIAIAPVPARRIQRVPDRRALPNAFIAPEPPPDPLVATLQAAPVAQIEQDGVFATPDDGKHWFALGMPGEYAKLHHMLRAGNVIGAGGALYVTPRALHVHVATHVFRVDAETGALTDFGDPSPFDAPWSVRVTDVREREGRPEILLTIDSAPQKERGTAVWAAHLRRDPSGWVELNRFFVPEVDDALLATVRFDPTRPDRAFFLSEQLRLERPLKLPPPAP